MTCKSVSFFHFAIQRLAMARKSGVGSAPGPISEIAINKSRESCYNMVSLSGKAALTQLLFNVRNMEIWFLMKVYSFSASVLRYKSL